MAVKKRFRLFIDCDTESERPVDAPLDSIMYTIDTDKYWKYYDGQFVEIPADEVILSSLISIDKLDISGVADGSKFLRDDGSWATPEGDGLGELLFLGKYTSLAALEAAYPTATAGQYAQVDAGPGSDVQNYNYDTEEGWILGGDGLGATTTDELIEGNTNLYFTYVRVRATLLTGLSLATGGVIADTDTVLQALGKLQYQITNFSPTPTPTALSVHGTTTGGGASVYAVTLNYPITAYAHGQVIKIKVNATSTVAAQVNVDSKGAKKIYKNPSVQAGVNDLIINEHYSLIYDSTLDSAAGGFLMLDGHNVIRDVYANASGNRGVIWVDLNHPRATNTRTGLSKYSIDRPFASIATAAALMESGDTLYVKSGTYGENVVVATNVNSIIIFDHVTLSGGAGVALSIPANNNNIRIVLINSCIYNTGNAASRETTSAVRIIGPGEVSIESIGNTGKNTQGFYGSALLSTRPGSIYSQESYGLYLTTVGNSYTRLDNLNIQSVNHHAAFIPSVETTYVNNCIIYSTGGAAVKDIYAGRYFNCYLKGTTQAIYMPANTRFYFHMENTILEATTGNVIGPATAALGGTQTQEAWFKNCDFISYDEVVSFISGNVTIYFNATFDHCRFKITNGSATKTFSFPDTGSTTNSKVYLKYCHSNKPFAQTLTYTAISRTFCEDNVLTDGGLPVLGGVTRYVSDTYGSDASAVAGRLDKPYTLAGAVTASTSGDTICLISGNYSATANIAKNGVKYRTFGGAVTITFTGSFQSLFDYASLSATTDDIDIVGDFRFVLNATGAKILKLSGTMDRQINFKFQSALVTSGTCFIEMPAATLASVFEGSIKLTGTGYAIKGTGNYNGKGSILKLNIYSTSTINEAIDWQVSSGGLENIIYDCSYYNVTASGKGFQWGAGGSTTAKCTGRITIVQPSGAASQLSGGEYNLTVDGGTLVLNGTAKFAITGLFYNCTIQGNSQMHALLNGYYNTCTFYNNQCNKFIIDGHSQSCILAWASYHVTTLRGDHVNISGHGGSLDIQGYVQWLANNYFQIQASRTIRVAAGAKLIGDVNAAGVITSAGNGLIEIYGEVKNLNTGSAAHVLYHYNGSVTAGLGFKLKNAVLVTKGAAGSNSIYVLATHSVNVYLYGQSWANMAIGGAGSLSYPISASTDLIIDTDVEIMDVPTL
jgi:hypothetical protein